MWSKLAVASREPSGLNTDARDVVCVRHTMYLIAGFNVPKPSRCIQAARRNFCRPSGLNASVRTKLSCPLNVTNSLHTLVSRNTCTVLPIVAANRVPLGLNATHDTPPFGLGSELRAGRDVPDFNEIWR